MVQNYATPQRHMLSCHISHCLVADIGDKIALLRILLQCIFAIRLNKPHASGGINNWGSACPLSEAAFPTRGAWYFETADASCLKFRQCMSYYVFCTRCMLLNMTGRMSQYICEEVRAEATFPTRCAFFFETEDASPWNSDSASCPTMCSALCCIFVAFSMEILVLNVGHIW